MKKSILSFLVFLCFLLFASRGSAQTATVKGFVYVDQTLEPALFATVYIQGTQYGCNTDVNGFYSISHLTPGNYILVVAYLGYDTLRTPITLSKDQVFTKKMYVKQSAHALGQVNVSAAQKSRETETQVSTYVITPNDMKSIPTIGGQPDIAQYLQVLPGVVSTGDQGGQLYIEGGQPIQNLVLLDGMTIFNPFHSIGLFSVFDGDIISDATVYAGGFNAEYGDRISSVMDIRTRDGNKKQITGKVDVSPFGAHALVEGPILKNPDDDPSKSSSSFIFSFKNSYLGQTSKSIYPYIDSGHGIPFNFADYYGKVSFNTSNGSKLNLFGFDFTDNVNYPGVATLNWHEAGVGLNFIIVPASSSSLMECNVDYSNYSISMAQAGLPTDTSSIYTFSAEFKWTQFLGNLTLYYGFNISGTGTDLDLTNPAGAQVDENQVSDELTGFVKLKYISPNKKLVIEPGFRAQYYASLGQFSPEPRVDAKYNISKIFRLKGAAGLYSQTLVSTIDETQVVDLFYGIITSPPTSDIPSNFTQQGSTTPQPVTNPLQRAYHVTFGFELDPIKTMHINVEFYEKDFLQTTTLNYDQIYQNNSEYAGIKPDTLTKPFLVQSGNAYGADISVKYELKHITLYGVYSLGYVTYWDGTYSFPPPFDRRNTVNLVLSYVFGKDLSWQANARFNYGSGFPFTPTQDFYPQTPLSNIGSNITTTNPNLGILYGDFDSERLPDYARMDVSLSETIQFSQTMALRFNASIINLFNRSNIFYFDRITGQRVNQLPILPTLSVGLDF
jgi:hypothetical protein